MNTRRARPAVAAATPPPPVDRYELARLLRLQPPRDVPRWQPARVVPGLVAADLLGYAVIRRGSQEPR